MTVRTLSSLTLLLSALLISGCEPGEAPYKSIEVASKGLYSGSFSDDGQYALVGSIYHGGSLWRSGKNDRLFNWNHKKGEYSNIIASGFSHDGNFALTADHQTMVLWRTQEGDALTFWTAPNEVLDVDLTNHGQYALLGLADYSAVLFDVKRGGIKRSFYHKNRVRAVTLSDDDQFALTGDDDGLAKLWDLNSGELLFEWQHQDQIVTVALSPKGDKAFTVAKYDKAMLWDTHTGKALGTLALKANAIRRGQAFTSAVFSADGRQLLTGNSDRLVQLWDTKTLTVIASWNVPKRDPWKPTSATILAVAFSPKDKQYFALSSNGFNHTLRRK